MVLVGEVRSYTWICVRFRRSGLIKISRGRIYNIKDVLGRKFNRLLVLSFSHQGKSGKAHWHCKCDCGKELVVEVRNLCSGHTKSCGCLRREKTSERSLAKRTKVPGKGGKNKVLQQYKHRIARLEKYSDLSDYDIEELISLPCYYCGSPPSQISMYQARKGITEEGREFSKYLYNGIDRKNSNLGYLIHNSVPCCKSCNVAKLDMAFNQFLVWLNKIHRNIEK